MINLSDGKAMLHSTVEGFIFSWYAGRFKPDVLGIP